MTISLFFGKSESTDVYLVADCLVVANKHQGENQGNLILAKGAMELD